MLMIARRLLPVLLVVAGCTSVQPTLTPAGSSSPSAEPPHTSATATGAQASPSPSQLPTIDPDWITRPALTCGEGPLFPPLALVIQGAELGTDQASDVLRETTRSGSSAEAPLPAEGWSRVSDGDQGVLFVAEGTPRIPWVQVSVVRTADGWFAQTWGECQLQVKFPGGGMRADIGLIADKPPNRDEAMLLLSVTELACAGGQPSTGRMQEPLVLESTTAVVVAISIVPLPGAHDCPGNPSLAVDVALMSPLGDRTILDGGKYPAAQLFP